MECDSQRLATRTGLANFARQNSFIWATGIEDTFVAEPHAGTGRVLDEYALTEHYSRWRQDLDLMADLNVNAARYGIPWYKVSPERGRWDWSFADQSLDHLLDLGIEPIVDLVHYGTPLWMEHSFANEDYPKYAAEYAHAVALRYKGRIRWYTPFNEPRISAYYSGKLGHWPPRQRGWSGFLFLLSQICKGVVLTHEALREVDSEIVHCHVDATDLYEPDSEAATEEASKRQEIVFLALDLLTGKFDPQTHPLASWTTQNGFRTADAEWFLKHHCEPDVIGINLYPMFSLKKLSKTGNRVNIRMPYAKDRQIVERLGEMYWRRYRTPLMVTETASAGSVAKRSRWLKESVEGCFNLRNSGIPLIGYTWWPTFSLVAWAYLASGRPIHDHLVPMGLWDLDRNLDRVRTPLVNEFAESSRVEISPVKIVENAYVS